MNKQIVVEIDDQGNITTDLKGFAGKGCEKVMHDFTDPGDTVLKTITKREFHETVKQQEKIKA